MGSSEFCRPEALAAITGNDAADGGRDSNRTTTMSKTIVSTFCTTSDEDMVAHIIYVLPLAREQASRTEHLVLRHHVARTWPSLGSRFARSRYDV